MVVAVHRDSGRIEKLGASAEQVGWLIGIYAACQLFSGPLLGRLSDHTGRKPLLLVSQIRANSDATGAVSGAVAGVVGMVPQGLVLLTTIAFGVASVTLARREVLVQELPAVEGLARVDVVCFDKTGTLTDGTIVFDRIERLDDAAPIEEALGAFAKDDSPNATLAAVARAFPPVDGWARTAAIPFSSARKWSAASFGPRGTWVLGAPEMVWQQGAGGELERAAELAATGRRVSA